MEGAKEIFLRMRLENYENDLSPAQRSLFTYEEVRESNEWENNKDDQRYLALKKNESQAKKAVQEYLFKKRHNMH